MLKKITLCEKAKMKRNLIITSIILLLLQKSSFLSSFTGLNDAVLSYKAHTHISPGFPSHKNPTLSSERDGIKCFKSIWISFTRFPH